MPLTVYQIYALESVVVKTLPRSDDNLADVIDPFYL